MSVSNIQKTQNLSEQEKTTLKRIRKDKTITKVLNNFYRKKKNGEVRYGDGEKEYVVRVEQGKIISVEETLYDDDFLDDDDYEDSKMALAETRVTETAYEFYLKLYQMKKGGSVTAEQVNTAEKAMKEAENMAIAQLMPVFDSLSTFIIQDAKQEGRRQARQKLKEKG